jgi:hypothetical protein
MKRIFVAVLLLTFVCSIRASAADLVLSPIPERNLPGMAFTVEVTVNNPGTDTLFVYPGCRLRVRAQDGSQFIAGFFEDQKVSLIELGAPSEASSGEVTPIRVGPGMSVVLDVPMTRYEIGPWIGEGRFTNPGDYSMSVEIEVTGSSGGFLLQSPAVIYSIDPPTGVDAQVWERLQRYVGDVGNKSFFSASTAFAAVAKFVSEEAPGSSYEPYVAGLSWPPYDNLQRARRLIRAIEEHPQSVMTPKNRMYAMSVVAEIMRGKVEGPEIRELVSFAEENMKALESIPDPSVRADAAQQFARIRQAARERGLDLVLRDY